MKKEIQSVPLSSATSAPTDRQEGAGYNCTGTGLPNWQTYSQQYKHAVHSCQHRTSAIVLHGSGLRPPLPNQAGLRATCPHTRGTTCAAAVPTGCMLPPTDHLWRSLK